MNIIEYLDDARISVRHVDFVHDVDCEIESVIDDLKEDLFQAGFEEYVIDVGWYPSFDLKGQFRAFIVRNSNWDKPVLAASSRSLKDVLDAIKRFISKKCNAQ